MDSSITTCFGNRNTDHINVHTPTHGDQTLENSENSENWKIWIKMEGTSGDHIRATVCNAEQQLELQ